MKQINLEKKSSQDQLARVGTIASILNPILVAFLGAMVAIFETHQNDMLKKEELAQSNRQQALDAEVKKNQSKVVELQAVGQFMPYLVSKDDRSNQVAITAIKALSNTGLAIELATLNPTAGTKTALQQIASKSLDVEDRRLASNALKSLVDFENVHVQPAFSGTVYPVDNWQEQDWTNLAAPDSRFKPGAVYRMRAGVPEYLSSLENCGVDPQELKPEETGFRGGSGSAKDIAYRPKTDFAPSVVLGIPGVSKGTQFEQANAARLQALNNGVAQINEINLKQWFKNHEGVVPVRCKVQLAESDVFVAYEAYFIGAASYQLLGQNDSVVDLSKALKISSGARATLANNFLMPQDRVYVAVRGTHIYKLSGNGTK